MRRLRHSQHHPRHSGPAGHMRSRKDGGLEWYLCLCFWWLIGVCVCISVSMSTSWQRGSERLLWWIVRQLSISRKRNQKKKVVGALCFVQFFVTVSVSVWSLYVSFLPAGLYLVNVDWAGAGAHLFLSAFMLCGAPGVLWVVARGVEWGGIRAYVCYLWTIWTVSSEQVTPPVLSV